MTQTAYQEYNDVKYNYGRGVMPEKFGHGPESPEVFGFTGKIHVAYCASIIRLSDGESTGYCKRTRGRRIGDVVQDAYNIIRDMVDEYCHLACGVDADAEWPEDVHWVAVYPVTGGSEGHYVHVDLVNNDGHRTMIMLGKTFQGMDHAMALCAKLIAAFGC